MTASTDECHFEFKLESLIVTIINTLIKVVLTSKREIYQEHEITCENLLHD